MRKDLKLLLKLTEETQGKRDGRVTQAAGQLPDETRPAVIQLEVCSPERQSKASWDGDAGTVRLGKSGYSLHWADRV